MTLYVLETPFDAQDRILAAMGGRQLPYPGELIDESRVKREFSSSDYSLSGCLVAKIVEINGRRHIVFFRISSASTLKLEIP